MKPTMCIHCNRSNIFTKAIRFKVEKDKNTGAETKIQEDVYICAKCQEVHTLNDLKYGKYKLPADNTINPVKKQKEPIKKEEKKSIFGKK